MDETMVNRFSKFRLKESEAEGVELEGQDIDQSRRECENSILGKVWGAKEVNFTGIKNTFCQLWCQKGDLKVKELGPNFFQFLFTDTGEKERALLRRPWFFDNQILIVHPWRPNLKECDPCFRHAQFWVQVRGLPFHWCSKDVGWKLGKFFPKCLNVIVPENGNKEGTLLKLLVELKLDVPLLRGTTLKLNEEGHWVDFKYEQLPSFCFYCGLIGHQERVCETKLSDSRINNICEDQYGSWLRASVPKGDKKKNNGGSTSGKQMMVRETQSSPEQTKDAVRPSGLPERAGCQSNASKLIMAVSDQPSLQEHRVNTDLDELQTVSQKGTSELAIVRSSELAGVQRDNEGEGIVERGVQKASEEEDSRLGIGVNGNNLKHEGLEDMMDLELADMTFSGVRCSFRNLTRMCCLLHAMAKNF